MCDETRGIIKCVDKANNIWAHAICINWTPEIYFVDDKRSKIGGQLDLERFNLTCHQCLKRNVGSCIQCDYKNCTATKHVRCAVDAGMIFNWEHMEKLVNKNYSEVEYDMPVFCEKHRVVGTLAYREGGKESLQNV